jgi:hypothetical protein
MKKGDTIQTRQDIPKGKSLMHGYTSLAKAEEAKAHIHKYYNLPEGALIKAGYDEINPGMFAVNALEDTYVTITAEVKWVVDHEVAIQREGSEGHSIIDLNEEENKGWVVIKSAAPAYQSDVEHMSDEQLRESIEGLRANRIAKPVKARSKKVAKVKEPPMSAQDKALSKVLAGMNAEDKLALQRKLGLIE